MQHQSTDDEDQIPAGGIKLAFVCIEHLHSATLDQFERVTAVGESQQKSLVDIVEARQQLRTLRRRLRKFALQLDNLPAKV